MLRLLGEDAEQWAEKHSVVPFKAPCQECGHELETTVPFAWGNLRGLVAPACSECGNTITPYCVQWDSLLRDDEEPEPPGLAGGEVIAFRP